PRRLLVRGRQWQSGAARSSSPRRSGHGRQERAWPTAVIRGRPYAPSAMKEAAVDRATGSGPPARPAGARAWARPGPTPRGRCWGGGGGGGGGGGWGGAGAASRGAGEGEQGGEGGGVVDGDDAGPPPRRAERDQRADQAQELIRTDRRADRRTAAGQDDTVR